MTSDLITHVSAVISKIFNFRVVFDPTGTDAKAENKGGSPVTRMNRTTPYGEEIRGASCLKRETIHSGATNDAEQKAREKKIHE